jgi:hypothetical protein
MRALYVWPAGGALLISIGLALGALPRRVRAARLEVSDRAA